MSKRVPGSHRTSEALRELMEGRYSESFGRTDLVHLATRLTIEEGLEAEMHDALDRGYYERGGEANGGYRNGLRRGRLKTAESFIDYAAPQVAGTAEPFRSEPRQHLKGHSEALESLAIEMPARGLSVGARHRGRLQGRERPALALQDRGFRAGRAAVGRLSGTEPGDRSRLGRGPCDRRRDRAAERWRTVKITDFERRQMAALRADLDQEYEDQTGLDNPASKAKPHNQLSSKSQT